MAANVGGAAPNLNAGRAGPAQAPPRPAGAGAGGDPNGSLFSKFRAVLLTIGSFVLTALVLSNAYYQRQQFYPSVVYITKSNPSMAVIYVQAFVFVILFGKLMRKIFFGRLRAAEFEHLMERSWYAITETCLAFTVFKDDFSPKFVALFTLLLFLKSFHWLAEDRVDFMERSPTISMCFHIRVIALAVLLATVDFQFILHAYSSTLTKGPSVQLVFGFEYAILLTIVANTVVKYILHGIDLYSENPWENKAVFMLYTELVIGFIKVILYFIFIAIMVRIYTLPLFAVRPMYLTMRAFKKALNDVVMSRRAIHNMNTSYPDATEEELANTDNVCIICREEMVAPATKKLPCNHIFHKTCLRSWFQRQQTCPTCRLDVLRHAQNARRTQAGAGAANNNNNIHLPGGVGGAQGQAAPPPVAPGHLQQPFQFNPHLFAFQFMQGRMQPQQPQQAAPAAAPQGAATNQGAPGAQPTFPGAAAPPAFFPPPPGMMFPPPPPPAFFSAPPPNMMFNVPPPMPPANFNGLTDEELRAMEGSERENIEARIRCLRNIQVLLDAAVMEMQQYSSIISQINRLNSAPATTAAAAAASSSAASTTASSTTATSSSSSSNSTSTTTTISSSSAAISSPARATDASPAPKETGAKPKIKKEEPEDSDAESIIKKMDDKAEGSKVSSVAPATRSAPASESSPEQDEIRRRRLAKFESPPVD